MRGLKGSQEGSGSQAAVTFTGGLSSPAWCTAASPSKPCHTKLMAHQVPAHFARPACLLLASAPLFIIPLPAVSDLSAGLKQISKHMSWGVPFLVQISWFSQMSLGNQAIRHLVRGCRLVDFPGLDPSAAGPGCGLQLCRAAGPFLSWWMVEGS